MSATQDTTIPAIGLDIGTSRIVLARPNGEQPEFRSQLNAFVSIPFSPMTERALAREGIPYARKDSLLVVHGDESERFADLLGAEIRRPMTAGMLNPAETDGTEIILRIVDSLLGEPAGRGARLVFSVPAPPLEADANLTYHEAALRELLTKRGYKVSSLNEGLAVVYAELESTNYSGIGISFGGGLCNVCLAHLAWPVASFSIPKAGDYIDASAAAVTGERLTHVRLEKENGFGFNGTFSSKIHQAIGVYYDNMIQSLLEAMKACLGGNRQLGKFRKPVPVVVSGGTALPEGFAARFAQALSAASLPIPISEVRLAPNPLYSTAKGALMAALTEA